MQAAGATIARPATARAASQLYGQVVEQLGLRVVRGDFGATGVLPVEPQLAAELGVSCILLREASRCWPARACSTWARAARAHGPHPD